MKIAGLFANAKETRELAAGEVIFAEGDEGAEMYGIVEGSVELSVDGRVIAKLGPDDTFGEMALVDSSPRMATATAVEPTVIAVIDRRQFLFLVHETPTFALQVMSSHGRAPSARRLSATGVVDGRSRGAVHYSRPSTTGGGSAW